MPGLQEISQQLRPIVDTVIYFIKARRREEAMIASAALLFWLGYKFSNWLPAELAEFLKPWRIALIGQSILYLAGLLLLAYGCWRIKRLVWFEELPPAKDRPSAIKGPMAFTEDDGALFRKLGRENDLQRLLGLVLDNQVSMVVVRGASGAGKTSLLRAGLTHILADKGVSYHYWEATPTEPDKWLLRAIRETWPDGAVKPSTLDELVNPSDELGRQERVIVLDQFEQLRGNKPIFRLLRKIAREARPPHRITWVIAFRREFSADWMDFVSPEQERGFRPPQDMSLRLFTPQQAREVISQLANESGISLEQSVVNNLVDAATVEGEVSPVDIGIGMLALAELSERQGGKTVTIRNYQFAGGAEGLLTQYISRCLELFAREDREIILKAMLALRDPETYQRIAEGLGIDELAKEAGAEARLLKPMLDRLAHRDIRLLEMVTTPGEPAARYRLPHERLTTAIHRLTGKLLADVDQVRLKFEKAFQVWKIADKRSQFLLKGKDLRLVNRFETQIPWGSNEQEKRAFLFQSNRRRKITRGIGLIIYLVYGVIFLAISIQYVRKEIAVRREKRAYSATLSDLQHRLKNLKKLELTDPLAIESFNCLSSQSLEELSVRVSSSSDFLSLSKCNSLKNLTLRSSGYLSDIEQLSRLSDRTQLSLRLGGSQVGDLEPLSKLTNLTQLSLDLGGSRVGGLEPLSKLNNLTQLSLDLGESRVSDLEPLSKLTNLTQLSLDLNLTYNRLIDSRIIEFEPLSKLNNLTQLSLRIIGSGASDLERLQRLTNLTQLSLNFSEGSGGQVSDLETPSKLNNLTQLSLDLSFSKVSGLEPLSKLTGLTQLSLDLSSSRVNDLEPLSKLIGLTQLSLRLGDNLASNLEPLSKLTNLTQLSLDFSNSQVIDLEPLLKLPNLTQLSLDLSYSRVNDLQPLSKFTNLAQLSLDLNLRDNAASKFEQLQKLTNLTQLSLDLHGSQMRNLEQLSKLTRLSQLSLRLGRSQVSDLEPLSKLTNLTRLSLDFFGGGRVSDLEPLSKLPRLQTLSVEFATRAHLMSLRNIAAGLVELKL